MKKKLLLLVLFLHALALIAQTVSPECEFNIQVTVESAKCYNNGKITILAVDNQGNELYIAPLSTDPNPYSNLSQIKYGYKKISEVTDTMNWVETSLLLVDTGTYLVGAQAICCDSSQSEENRYSIVEAYDTVVVTSSYIKPKVTMIETLAPSASDFGIIPSLSCMPSGRVQLRIYDGVHPYTIRVCDKYGNPLDTLVFPTNQYMGDDDSRYDFYEYYSVENLSAGEYMFFVEDGCDYHLPRVSQAIGATGVPHISKIYWYNWSGSYVDSNVIKTGVVLEVPTVHYLDSEYVQYRFIHKNIAGQTDTTEWKMLDGWDSFQAGTNEILVMDTIHNAGGYCEIYGNDIVFQARTTVCGDTVINLTKKHKWDIPDNSFFSETQWVSDSIAPHNAVYDSCGYWTEWQTQYGHNEYIVRYYNSNEYHFRSSSKTESYTGSNFQVTYPLYWIYRDTRDGRIIKVDTIRKASQPTASWSRMSVSLSYPASVLSLSDVEKAYGPLGDSMLVIPVSYILYDAKGCPIYSKTRNMKFEKQRRETPSRRYDMYWTSSTNYTSNDYCCRYTRQITFYGYNVPALYSDRILFEVYESPQGNRYNFTAVYDLLTQSWTFTKADPANLASISAAGYNITLSDYCLPSGIYKYRISSPYCDTLEYSTTAYFTSTNVWEAEPPQYNLTTQCSHLYIRPTLGSFLRNEYNEYLYRNGRYFTPWDTVIEVAARFRVKENVRPGGSQTGFDPNTYILLGDSMRVTAPGDYVIEMTPVSSPSGSLCPVEPVYDTISFEGGTPSFQYAYGYVCEQNGDIGFVRVKAEEGTPPYTYTLFSGPNLSGTILGTNSNGRFDRVPVRSGQEVSVKVEDQCEASFYINQTITDLESVNKSWFFDGSDAIETCEGSIVRIYSIGLDELVSYHWTGPNGFESSSRNSSVFLPRGSEGGWYKVVIEGTGCQASLVTDSVYVTVLQSPAVTLYPDTTICPGEEVEVRFVTRGNGSVHYTIAQETYGVTRLTDYENDTSFLFLPETATTFYVYEVEDDNCNYSIPEDTVMVAIRNHIASACDVISQSETVCHMTNGMAEAFSVTLSSPYYVKWYRDSYQSELLKIDTIYNDTVRGSYFFEELQSDTSLYVTVSNAEYCESKYGTVFHWMNIKEGTTSLRCGESLRFYDSGGKNGGYSPFEDATHVFYSSDGQPVTLVFEMLNLHSSDRLLVYSGSVQHPDSMIGDFSGSYEAEALPSLVSSGPAMTIRFLSNGKNEADGWEAIIGNNPKPVVAAVHVFDTLQVAAISASSQVHYNGSASVTAVAVGGRGDLYRYEWETSLDSGETWTFYSAVMGTGSVTMDFDHLTQSLMVRVRVSDASSDSCAGYAVATVLIPVAHIRLALSVEVPEVERCVQDYPVQVTVRNRGLGLAEQVTAKLQLPDNVRFADLSDTLWSLGDLAGGDTITKTVVIRSHIVGNQMLNLPVKGQIWSCLQGDSVPTVVYGDWDWAGSPRQEDEDVDTMVVMPFMDVANYHIEGFDDTVCYMGTAHLRAMSDIVIPQYIKWWGDPQLRRLLKEDTLDSPGAFSEYDIEKVRSVTSLYVTIENDGFCPAVHNGVSTDKFTTPVTQVVNMGDGSTLVGMKDHVRFFDSGGSAGNYGNDESFVHTFITATGALSVRFNTVRLSTGDNIVVYDGISVDAPILDIITGTNLFARTYNSTTGALTFRWTSNSSGTAAGWDAQIVNTTNYVASKATAYLRKTLTKSDVRAEDVFVCYGDDATLTASTQISPPQYFVWYDEDCNMLKEEVRMDGTSSLDVYGQTSHNVYYVTVANDTFCPVIVPTPATEKTICVDYDQTGKTSLLLPGQLVHFFDDGGETNGYGSQKGVWSHTFEVEEGSVALEFTSFSTYSSGNALLVFDGPDAMSSELVRLFGSRTSSMPLLITSTGRFLTVVWENNSTYSADGWIATLRAVNQTNTANVNDEILLDINSNHKTTMVYPQDQLGFYDNGGHDAPYSAESVVHTHTFTAVQGNLKAKLNMLHLRTTDTLYVYDADTDDASRLLARLSGTTASGFYYSTGKSLTFKFFSMGNTGNYKGWDISLSSMWEQETSQARVYLRTPFNDKSLNASDALVCYNDDAVLRAYSDSATVFAWYASDKSTLVFMDTALSGISELRLDNVRHSDKYYITTLDMDGCPTVVPYQYSTVLLNSGNDSRTTRVGMYDYVYFFDNGGPGNNYYYISDYSHTFEADQGQVHLYFNLQKLGLSREDTLFVYDGTIMDDSHCIGFLTNRTLGNSSHFFSSNGNLTVRFQKVSTSNYRGWEAYVLNHPLESKSVWLSAATHSGTTYISPVEKVLFSDNSGPNNIYVPVSTPLEHTFRALQGNVRVVFGPQAQNYLNSRDTLYVYDGPVGGPLLAALTQNNLRNESLTSSGNEMSFRFVTHSSSSQYAGWYATIESNIVPPFAEATVSIRAPHHGENVVANDVHLCYGDTAVLTAAAPTMGLAQYYTWFSPDWKIVARDTVNVADGSHLILPDQRNDTLYLVTVHNDNNCPTLMPIRIRNVAMAAIPDTEQITVLENYESVYFYDDGGPNSNYGLTQGSFIHTFMASEGTLNVDFKSHLFYPQDTLFVYDGMAPDPDHLIEFYTSNCPQYGGNFTTQSSALTFKFAKHGGGTHIGWRVTKK